VTLRFDVVVKANQVRSVPMPAWTKQAIEAIKVIQKVPEDC